VCDVVEFHSDENGVCLSGRKGCWNPCPVEYKRGRPKTHDADRLQLCAQAMCLEEMLVCAPIETAYLFYGETKGREAVALTQELRQAVREAFAEMYALCDRRHTPRVKKTKSCVSCSLRDYCVPELPEQGRVLSYISGALAEGYEDEKTT
jgi:CRISPR-associated exonuclease Cas4